MKIINRFKERHVEFPLVFPNVLQFVVVFIGSHIVLNLVVVIRQKMIIIWKR